MNLSEVEIFILHELEEANEELYQLEFDLSFYFYKNELSSDIQDKLKVHIRNLESKKLIEPVNIVYKKINDHTLEIQNEIKLNSEYTEIILNNQKNWDKDYLFKNLNKYYFRITEYGIETLNEINLTRSRT